MNFVRRSKINIKTNNIYIFFIIYVFTLVANSVCFIYDNDYCLFMLKIIRYICYIFFGIKIFQDWKNGKKITFPIIFMIILAVVIAITTNNKNILFMIYALIAVRDIKFEETINLTLKIFMPIYFIIIGLSILGVIPDWTFYRGTIVRHSLGFIYATDAIGFYLIIILMFFYIKKSKVSVLELLILETINIFLYDYTDGRTSFILISILLFILLLSKNKMIRKTFYNTKIQQIFKFVCYALPIMLFIFFHLIVFLYGQNNNIAIKINEVLSQRIKYTYQAYNEYSITPFGQRIKWYGWGGYGYVNLDEMDNFKYNYVDCSYARILLDDGIVFTIIVLIGYTYVLVQNYKNKNYWLMLSIIFVLIWSFIEQYLVNIGKNVFILAFIPLLEKWPIEFLSYNNVVKKLKKV